MARLIERFPLSKGNHPSPSDGMCTMELVAWLAGEEHSDQPRCACPVLGALVRACNDLMPDAARERYLRPLAPLLVHTVVDRETEVRRAFRAADFAMRVLAPMTLERLGRYEPAAQLREEPEVDEPGAASAAYAVLHTLAREVHAAAWTLRHARQSSNAEVWVTGVAHAAREVGDDAGWRELAALIRELARSGASTRTR